MLKFYCVINEDERQISFTDTKESCDSIFESLIALFDELEHDCDFVYVTENDYLERNKNPNKSLIRAYQIFSKRMKLKIQGYGKNEN